MSEYTIEALREDTARLIAELRAEEEAKKHTYRKYLVNG